MMWRLDRMILSLVLFRICGCIRFFNNHIFKTYRGLIEYTKPNSLFSMSIYFSPEDRNFYVGAPNAVKENTDVEVGGVFQCPSQSDRCVKLFSVPNEQRYTTRTPHITPLFGMTLSPTTQGKLIVCSPNIAFTQNIRYFCYEYYSSNGSLCSNVGYAPYRFTNVTKLVDNYGMMLANTENNGSLSFLIGQNNLIYFGYEGVPNDKNPYLIKTSGGLNTTNIPVFNIPSYSILVNPQDSIFMYAIVTYHQMNNFLGSFEVMTKDLLTQQYLEPAIGTFYQYFGFSATFGLFNDDECMDIVISAPFFSEVIDEGIVYIYFCNRILYKFYKTPMVIRGDNIPSARFGIAVIEIGDWNHDGIQDIAVLAPYWYNNMATVFIYASDGKQLSSNYAHKIIMFDSTNAYNMLSYGLLAKTDQNMDRVIDLLITYPSNNTMNVFTGIAYKRLMLSVDTNILYDMPNPKYTCFNLDNVNKCANTSQYKVNTCVTILFWNDSADLQDQTLLFRYSLENSTGSVIYEVNMKSVKEYSIKIASMINCFEIIVIFLYDPMSVTLIQLDIEAKIDVNDSIVCTGLCVEADPIFKTYEISTYFYTCRNKTCQPNFTVTEQHSDVFFLQGDVTYFNLTLLIRNSGQTISYFMRLVIECPRWVDISSIKFDKMEYLNITTRIEISKEDLFNVEYTVQVVTSQNDTIQTNLGFMINSPIGIKSFYINTFLYDPMYINPPRNNVSILLSNKGGIPVALIGTSSPQTISISVNATQTNDTNQNLVYIIQFTNSANSGTLQDVEIQIHTTIIFNRINVLDLQNVEFPNDFIAFICNNASIKQCDIEKMSFSSNSLGPQTWKEFKIEYEILKTIQNLIETRPSAIQLNATACYTSMGMRMCNELKILSELIYPLKTNYSVLIWPIVLVVLIIVIILIVLVIIIIKTNFLKNFKRNSEQTNPSHDVQVASQPQE